MLINCVDCCSTCNINLHISLCGEQGWRSGESARLPPMWPGFDSRSRCHMWVEFVVGSRPCSEGFLRVLRFSSLHKNQHFQIPSGISGRRATLWRCHCKFQFFFFNFFFFSLIHAQCSVFFLIVFKLIGPAEIASAPTSQQAVEGNGATLFCNATCNPQPNITWTKQGNNSVLSSSETLTLTNLRRGDNGTGYICKVQNSLGSDEATTTITVLCE